jgi:HD-like signal output (HDOD) protein
LRTAVAVPIANGVIDLDAVSRAAGCFEPLPTSVSRLAVLAVDESPDLAQIVDIVRYDQALTAALLRSANSAWSAARTEIATVKDAVVRLGAGPVMALALGVNVRSRLEAPVPAYDLAEGELWSHSVRAMLAAETLMPRVGPRLPAETPTAALLHDVGKLVMTRFVDRTDLDNVEERPRSAPGPMPEATHLGAAQRQRPMNEDRPGGLTRVNAEREVLGLEHAELGGMIGRAWGLPASLVVGISDHHAPPTAAGGAGLIAHAVHLADVVAKAVGGGPDDNADLETFAAAMGELGLTATAYDDVCVAVADRFAEVAARFG